MQAVGGALPIVEEEEHGGTLRHGAEEITELPESVRANDVAVVRRQEVARLPLADEHTEMVLPEVDHDLLKLPIARDGPRHLGGLQIAEGALCLTDLRGQLRIAHDLLARVAPGHAVALRRQLPLALLLSALRLRIQLHQVGRRHRERRIAGKELVGRAVVDALGRELKPDPAVHPRRSYFLHVAGTRSEGEAVENLLDLLFRQQLPRFRRRYDDERRQGRGRALMHAAAQSDCRADRDVTNAHALS